jgi:hypothetical protein
MSMKKSGKQAKTGFSPSWGKTRENRPLSRRHLGVDTYSAKKVSKKPEKTAEISEKGE